MWQVTFNEGRASGKCVEEQEKEKLEGGFQRNCNGKRCLYLGSVERKGGKEKEKNIRKKWEQHFCQI
jgi:hypothetical protein